MSKSRGVTADSLDMMLFNKQFQKFDEHLKKLSYMKILKLKQENDDRIRDFIEDEAEDLYRDAMLLDRHLQHCIRQKENGDGTRMGLVGKRD